MIELDKAYDASAVEDKIYQKWLDSGYFTPENLPERNLKGQPFSMVLPPPNVTGTLHMGHAFEDTIQDITIRYHRMKGEKTLWVPGTDHAAISTQSKFEKDLYKKEKKSRHDYSRDEFVKMIDEFALANQESILSKLNKMGLSLDWSRLAFTLDKPREAAVRTAFKRMYDTGLIYRGFRVVNWDPKGQTTVSDDEVVHEPIKASLYTFKYSKDFPISIATTRPETKVGDTAVAVHPDDKRYKKYVGQTYQTDFAGVPLEIKIIADESVDPEFGTGALGVTPAHSMADWEMAQRHDLPLKPVINEFAKMTVGGELLEGKKTVEAREVIVQWLKDNGLLEKEETIDQNISKAERTNGTIEPLPKLQWFVDVDKPFAIPHSRIPGIETGQQVTLKQIMKHTVEAGHIEILPERFEKVYHHWIDHLRDWCISRQILYGHRIPVWYRTWPGLDLAKIYTMGFHERTEPQVKAGKTVTYRLRDHGLKIGDRFGLLNSQSNQIFGYGTIVEIKQTTVEHTPLNDPAHSATYKKRQELIEAFQFHHPEIAVTKDTPVWIYSYSFGPVTDGEFREQFVGMESPAGDGWEQDPDTLDTWFSSALWTFSTLGWPDATDDLVNFHPTSVIMPGYEILFVWVARMVLMSGFLLGDIPFRQVYLHGLVRDSKGQKFSKSLDNGVDPLEVSRAFGTDALRMSLVAGVAPGNDTVFDLQKVKGYKHFGNKLWNIARFILANVDRIDSAASLDSVTPNTEGDKIILEKLNSTIAEVTLHLDNLRLHEAAQSVYQFTWHEFADIYIEASKQQLKDPDLKAHTEKILMASLINILKLLHPFMPFITEEIWSKLGQEDLIIVAEWPKSQ